MIYLRHATDRDVDMLLCWRTQTANRLANQYGTDQWSTPYPRGQLQGWIEQGCTLMAALDPDGAPVATMTVTAQAPAQLWAPHETAVAACYLHKVNVILPGQGIGSRLLRWIRAQAADHAVPVVRLDAWTTNHHLHAYYRREGFTHVRTVPGTVSGALFQAPARPDPHVVTSVNTDRLVRPLPLPLSHQGNPSPGNSELAVS